MESDSATSSNRTQTEHRPVAHNACRIHFLPFPATRAHRARIERVYARNEQRIALLERLVEQLSNELSDEAPAARR